MATLQAKFLSSSTWVNLPEPSLNGLVCGDQDVDAPSTGRDQSGDMHRDKVNEKRKFSMTWNNIWAEDVATIMQFTHQPFFQLRCDSDLDNRTYEGVFYAGDRNGTLYSKRLGANKQKKLYSSFTVNFIER